MRRLILLLGLLAGLMLPLAPALAQSGPMRNLGPATSAAAPTGEESLAPFRWLAQQQRAAALGFRKLLADLRAEHSWRSLVTAVGLAFLYGVAHAAGPGHGKMIVISYFLAHRARLRDGLWMGVRIALTHVAAALVIVLGLFLLFNGHPGPDFESSREIRLVAYAGMIALGLWFLIDASERLRRGESLAACGHDHGPGHAPHAHAPAPSTTAADRWRARLTGLIAGAVPCTGAIIVLVFCAANGLWLAGLLMVSAIALGMAVTMTGLGLLTLVARAPAQRWADHQIHNRRVRAVLGLTGPALVTLGGIVLLALTV